MIDCGLSVNEMTIRPSQVDCVAYYIVVLSTSTAYKENAKPSVSWKNPNHPHAGIREKSVACTNMTLQANRYLLEEKF